jgi:decaprenylphospho-beta-D-erythro-pentofuranosid-2-ulose 2-reductase
MPQFRRAVIIGASSGIGLALARALAANGTQVALVARRAAELDHAVSEIGPERAHAYPHDVTQTDEIPALFAAIAHDLGGVDLVVYAAGILPEQPNDAYDTTMDEQIIAINFTGAVAWLNAAAARFARTRDGTIIGIGSVAGDRGRRGNPIYGATKAALAAYLESLRNRLAVRGVTVVTVKPGYVATQMIAGAKTPRFLPVIPPEQAAREILAAAARGGVVAYVPPVWGTIMRVIRAIPSRVFRGLNV